MSDNKISLIELDNLIREREAQGIFLYDIGESFDDEGNGDPWSVLIWAEAGIDESALHKIADGMYPFSGEGVRVASPALLEYSIYDIWCDYFTGGIEHWPIYKKEA